MKLNLGCGKKQYPDFINVDIDKDNFPNICMDAEKYISFTLSGSIDFINMESFIEHIREWETFLKDCKRCLKIGGKIYIWTDHVLNVIDAFGNPNHKSYFNCKTFILFARYNNMEIKQTIHSRLRFLDPIINLRIKEEYYLIDMFPFISAWLFPAFIELELTKK